MKYFTLHELTNSSTAKAQNIDNSPTYKVIEAITALTDNVLDPLREAFGKAIYVNSGYRCAALNKAVGGTPSSQHLKGEAADISAGCVEDNRRLFRLAINLNIPFDQLIDEGGYKWLHISHRNPKSANAANRRQVLHIK